MDLQGKVVVITGGSRGIGLALCHAFAAEGAQVFACARSASNAQDTSVTYCRVDVCDSEEVACFIDDVVRTCGRIDVLILNAGVAGRVHPLEDEQDSDIAAYLQANVASLVYTLRACLPVMKRQREVSAVVTIGSTAARRAHPGLALYSATKSAALGLTQAVARELIEAGTSVRCFSVSPGGTRTAMREALFGSEENVRSQDPAAVAQAVVQCVRDDARVSNGADVQVRSGEIVRIIPME